MNWEVFDFTRVQQTSLSSTEAKKVFCKELRAGREICMWVVMVHKYPGLRVFSMEERKMGK